MTEVFLFKGPGLPESEVEKFNQRMSKPGVKPVVLHIRDAHNDPCSSFGKVNIGYNAPENTVDVDYAKYYPPVELGLEAHLPEPIRQLAAGFLHVMIPDRPSSYNGINSYPGIEGGHSREKINELLDRKNLPNSHEKLRTRFLGPVVWGVVSAIRAIVRFFFGSRAQNERGLHIGTYEDGSWTTHLYRPEDLAKRITAST